MQTIRKMMETAMKNGYNGDVASAKICQDIVLKALAVCPLSRNVTIKAVLLCVVKLIMYAEQHKIWILTS